MELLISPQEQAALARAWSQQAPVSGPVVDYANRLFPFAPAAGDAAPTAQDLTGRLGELLGWPEWVEVYAQPTQAMLAISALAKAHSGRSGLVWADPGTGSPLESASGEPGAAVIRADHAPVPQAPLAAQEEFRSRGMLVAVDETNTGWRLSPGGAVRACGLEPDLVLFSPSLPQGGRLAFLAGRGPRPKSGKSPDAARVAEAMAYLNRLADPALDQRLMRLGRGLALGLNHFKGLVGLNEEVTIGGPHRLPRLDGKRLWAFIQVAAEEGLKLSPLVYLDPTWDEEQAREMVWPRLARALSRLKVLPAEAMAPLGWKDAACNHIH